MIIKFIVLAGIAVPILCATILGLLLWRQLLTSETVFTRSVFTSYLFSIACFLTALIASIFQDVGFATQITWFALDHYHYFIGVTLDSLSLILALFFSLLVCTIGAFSRRYLHNDKGFFRFYFLLCLFGAGVEIVVLASNLDFLFIGWEIVGFTSAMLIAFFYERQKPVEHALRAFLTYRICDAGLLCAIILLHHLPQGTQFVPSDTSPWNAVSGQEPVAALFFAGLMLVWAGMGKSAQVPLSGWLPRAMEGPTPSSAIFYGAISIHLGAFLLLRITPVIEHYWQLQALVFAVGLGTAIHGSLSGRVQTDIKCTLAYASITQVGVIWVEISLGLYELAVIHLVGHAALRSLQILRSPSLLHDHQHMEEDMGNTVPRASGHIEKVIPSSVRPWVYRHALERGFLDGALRYWIIAPLLYLLRKIDELDNRWSSYINNR